MIGRFRNSILDLLTQLHAARNNPFDNIQKWLTLQEKLLKKTIYVENRIRTCKKEIKALNTKRKNRDKQLSKEESISVKNAIKEFRLKIEGYHRIILILKSIADGIAFTFIDKHDIKPQNMKESPGFLSQKKGLILERKILRKSFNHGVIAILNDLTSVLRYTDVTLITERGFIGIEAKSSKMYNERIKRQFEKAKKLYNYLEEDQTIDLYGKSTGVMHRVALGSKEVNYLNNFSNLLDSAKTKGSDYCKFEDGFSCLIIFDEVNASEILGETLKDIKFIKPFYFYLNMNKFMEDGYYPFSLIFDKPKHYLDFLEGKMIVMVFIDYSVIEKISANYGYMIEEAKKEGFAFTFKSKDGKKEVNEFSISEHFFLRTSMEMVSLNWLLTDSFNQLGSRVREIVEDNKI